MNRSTIPTDCASTPYRCSPTFTQDTLPAALQSTHTTKAGVWGIIRILEGALRFHRRDGLPPELLDAKRPGLVAPQEPHYVEIIGPMSMHIEFYDHAPRSIAT